MFYFSHLITPLIFIFFSEFINYLLRIENRVRKGGHNIPASDVARRYENRLNSLAEIAPLCDRIVFYDNENGFVKVAEITNNKFRYTNGYKPNWIVEVQNHLKENCKIGD